MNSSIPVFTLEREIENYRAEYERALSEVLESGQFVQGPFVEKFESELCQALRCDHAIAVNSGTDALVISLRALGIGPGDEVLVPAFSFFATAEAVHLVGATPVFVDVQESDMNISTDHIAPAITQKTKAMIPVHLFGHPVGMEDLFNASEPHHIPVIEDAAQSFGSFYKNTACGTLGELGAFSFYPTKNLGAFGDGGAITTNNEALAVKCRELRNHGSPQRYVHEDVGYNSRLDAFQAAILSLRLKRIDSLLARRSEIASRYQENLSSLRAIKLPVVNPPGLTHSFHQFTIRIPADQRKACMEYLNERGIGTMIYYPTPMPMLELYKKQNIAADPSKFPVSVKLASEVLSLPMFPELTNEEVDRVSQTLMDFFKEQK